MLVAPPERWRRIEALFAEVLERPAEERATLLDRACADDPALRTSLDRLLRAHNRADDFLERFDTSGAAALFALSEEDDEDNATIGRYRVARRLGRGGMGVVYLAHDPRLDRSVALKLLPPYLSADAEAARRLTEEAKAASALDHPHIITIYEIGETADERLFLAMAFYEGETLRERITRGPLPVEEAIGLAVQVAEGLAAAHRKGIVHRDVKPENLLVTADGVLKILDFGLAKVGGQAHTRPGVTPGTAAYMSPEQTRGAPVDPRTDLWSLGVVIYEMLAGQRPFRGEGAALVHGIRHDEPAPLRQLRPELPTGPARVVERCLAKDPAARYPDAGALLVDLRSVQTGGVIGRGRGRPARRYFGLAVLSVLLMIGGLYLRGRAAEEDRAADAADVARAESRLAVLPLSDLSPDPDAAYFADGLTEELIARLSKLGGLHVIARASVMPYRDTDRRAAEIGRELDVRAILRGSVRKAGDQVRVSVQLIDAEREVPLWSGDYDAKVEDVAAVQRQIAEQVAEALGVRMRAGEARRLAKRGSDDPKAYELYLRGRYFLHSRDYSVESLQRSKTDFEQALDLDPTYAQAWAGLANVYTLLGSTGVLTPDEAQPRARAAAEQALAFDDELAEAHTALAATLSDYYWDWDAAERHFQRALELDPSYATAHQWYATNVLQTLGRVEEAVVAARKAQALDPLSPMRNYAVGQALYFARRYDEAEVHLQRLRELYPDFPLTYIYLAQMASLQGRHAAAIAAAEKAHALYVGEGGLSAILGYVYARAGEEARARALLRKLDARAREQPSAQRINPFHEAYIHLGLGEHDQALTAFEQAYEDRIMYMAWLGIEPIFEPLRSYPRYQVLLEKMGIGS
jgi:TolB-like protein/Tfp pilus assembly protein PilF